MMSFEAGQNALRERRIACAGCNMFEWGDKMKPGIDGKLYCSEKHRVEAEAKLAKNKAPVFQLVPRGEPFPTSGEERRAA